MKNQEKVLRIYADGVFDSFHFGHSNVFKQARQAFPNQKIWLIAGVCDQVDVELHKGPTINTEKERVEMVRQNRYVDQVLEKAPWVITEKFMNQQKIDFVCHDDAPYVTTNTKKSASEQEIEDVDDAYAICKKLGRFKATQRTKGISTTDIVAKILRNKEMYYIRNLNRGVSREKLGMSLMRYWKLKIQLMICPHRYDKPKDD